ncbi:MAG TPA: GNAT family N-acetyltransferase [Thermoanaerobaculia bacterium]|nr:GNAT family N-acetyltransferase [Thermoanaerobaculia bacterium]
MASKPVAEELRFEPLAAPDERSFEELYGIYAASIAIREQKTRAQITALVLRPDYKVLLAKRQGVVIGLSMVFLPVQESFCLLEYMAVQAMHRNSGVGASLFRHSIQVAASIQGETSMLLEVDSPDQEIHRRRQQFYRRLGCRRIEGLSYLLPLSGEGPPPEMDLMVHVSPAMSSIPKSALEHWLKVIYQDAYGCSSDDFRIALMLEAVPDPVGLV